MRNKINSIAFIVPCLNEGENVSLCMDHVLKIRERDPKTVYSVMFVDDGSTDGSPEIMRVLSREHIGVSYILLTRNFGAHVAWLAGLDSVFSDAVVFIPCDQKIDSDLIIEMLQYARDEADVVIGERKNSVFYFFFLL
jgi:glycosyltransferase involved in cell wall biosynthesis